ncbi:MAG: hypothetical protein HYW63_02995 [Candidatus Levybacteria bacterium]|nr:hypothetical protein [Candidatus Levybacteria bacterium]
MVTETGFETGESRAAADAADKMTGVTQANPWTEHRRAGLLIDGGTPQEFITGRTPDGESITMRVGHAFAVDGGIMHVPPPEEAPNMAKVMPRPRTNCI